ncbi:MAG: hypothetical protein Q9162_002679 [Coniocarpon cinnabarinum]
MADKNVKIGMGMMASVPDTNTVFPLLGRPQDFLNYEDDDYSISFPRYLGAQYDASTTNLTYSIPGPDGHEPVELTVSFLSPITPSSSLRQSIPASYINVEAKGSFDVALYMDVNGDFVSGDPSHHISWYLQTVEFDENGALWTWQIQRRFEEPFVEYYDRSEWGRLHFTGPPDAKYECGDSHHVRQAFAKHNGLRDRFERNYRGIRDNEPAFAFSKTLHLSSADANKSETLFTIAHIQDEIVQFASERGLTLMRPLWKSWFSSEWALLMFHYLDYHTAARQARAYSSRLAADAYSSGGAEYVDILALSARQVMGATSFSGTPENPLLFLKEISSNGNTQTVDVIFPAFPFFLYTNPRWLAYLLEPLLEHQLSGQYPNQYSMHDLGAHFPNETGHADGQDEYMPVEECGDMLIMALALSNSLQYGEASEAGSPFADTGFEAPLDPHLLETRDEPYKVENGIGDTPFPLQISSLVKNTTNAFGTDDNWGGPVAGQLKAKAWLARSYSLLKQWTTFLIDNSLRPGNQLSTDDFAGWLPLQSNLALKGMVGIRAMSEIADILGHEEERMYYRNISDVYVEHFMRPNFGMSRDGSHAKLAYDWYGSWTTLYSLYADAVLCFHPQTDDVSTSTSSHSSNNPNAQIPISVSHDTSNSSHTNFLPTDLYLNQSAYYSLNLQRYGLPLESRHLYTKSDWLHQAAAVATSSLRQELIHRHARWINETCTDLPLSDLFDTEGRGDFGEGIRFIARPVVGSHWSRLVLERSCGGEGMEFLEGR